LEFGRRSGSRFDAGTTFALKADSTAKAERRRPDRDEKFGFTIRIMDLDEDGPTMRNRRHTLLWMKDLLEHMSQCHDQLQWAADGPTEAFLTESLLGDLVECQKLCETLRGEPERSRSVREKVRGLVMS
jgi:hypothetical protein